MPESKPFWTTVPGIVSGVAATVTGLAVLIPLMLGAAGHDHKRNVAATQGSPSPGGSAAVTTTTTTSTSGADVTGSSSPGASAGAGSTDTSSGSSSGTSAGAASPTAGQSNGPAALSATPASVTFGSVASGKSSQDVSVTIANTGGAATVSSIAIAGQNQGAFTITGTTCATGSTVTSGGSCQVTLRFSPPSVGSDAAKLELHYGPPDGSFMSVDLSGTGSLL